MRASNRENWEGANEQLGYFLKVLADEGYPDELIADVIMASGVCLSTKSTVATCLFAIFLASC